MRIDLLPEFLEELHNVYDVDTYLLGLSTPASLSHGPSPTSLWGDIFCIKWFSIWLSVLVKVWSFSTGRCYLSFVVPACEYEYNILFHDHRPTCGHFEPLLSYQSMNILMPLHNSPFYTCPHSPSSFQFDVAHIEQALLEKGFYICNAIVNDCHDSLFHSICKLAPWFDMASMRKIIAQTFCNSFLANEIRALRCLNKYLIDVGIANEKNIDSWQGYIINSSMVYKDGNIEGGDFSIQWLCEMLSVDIHILTPESRTIS
jgi:hypothetical protein